MLYDYNYDLVAIGISLILLTICLLRKTFPSKSLKIFYVIILCNLIASILDTISCFTISFPDRWPLWFNYVVSLGYLFFYNMLSVLFLFYIDSKARIAKISKLVHWFCVGVTLFYAVTILSSPWTHWVAYFTNELTYQHGPVFMALAVLPFINFFLEVLIFIYAKHRFSLYQVYASVSMIVGMSISVIVSMIWPRILIGQLSMAMIMFFIYVAYENPAHYNFRDTQCLNRSAFTNYLLEYQKRGKVVGLLSFSIHDYSYIRLNRGSAFADLVSVKVADFLYRNFKSLAFALSNDIFVILVSSPEEATMATKLVKDFVASPILIEEVSIKIDVSTMYVEQVHFDRYSVEDFESGLLYCIENGLNSGESGIEKSIEKIRHNNLILHAISRAISDDLFQVYYQPIYSTAHDKFESAEALLRLTDSELGFINPEELVTLAEQNGFIDQIGEIVFRKVCAFMKEQQLLEHGLKYIEVNLSPKQCLQENIVPLFQSIMAEYQIAPSRINLEITETAEVVSNDTWLASISALSASGVEFSIDDFGSGFASAEYLITVPVSIVKIDKLILWQAMEDKQAMLVLLNTIQMIKDLGKKIVVEGVESEEMVNLLKAHHVDYLQGFYFSKPITGSAFMSFICEKNN